MRYLLILAVMFSLNLFAVEAVVDQGCKGDCSKSLNSQNANASVSKKEGGKDFGCGDVLTSKKDIIISVVGQGVAPVNTTSPAQAYALAKRAAIADGYRLIAEKVKGIKVEGQDLIQNMMVKRSTVRTAVYAMVRNANVVETTFKNGLCEVEMEIHLSYSAFAH